LYGLEICPRAAQLAELALVFKAREKSRRFFQPEYLVRPNIIELRDVSFAENELQDYINDLGLGEIFNQPMLRLLHQFEDAKNFGSLIQPCLDERAIAEVRRAIEAKDLDGQLFLRETHLKVLRVLEQAEALTQRYHVVVANPPYMGTKGMNGRLAQFAKDSFPNSKFDLFSMFIERNVALTLKGGRTALITMQSWMFLSSYNELRESLIGSIQFSSMLHLGPRGFDSISGEVVQTVAFVFNNCAPTGTPSVFFRLIDGTSEEKKSQMFFETAALPTSPTKFVVSQANFSRIPGHVVAYWLSHQVLEAFSQMPALAESISLRKGLTTMNNGRFLRFWHEVAASRTKLDAPDSNSARLSKARWFPVLKGGGSRRWFGLNDYLINWENDGEELKSFISSIYNGGSYTKEIRSEDQYFKPSITWSTLTSDALSMRLNGAGSIFESKGSVGLARSQEELLGGLAFCNSVVAGVFLNALSPTLDYNAGPVSRVPYANPQIGESARIATSCVSIARADWDNFETSWDFRDQPLLRPGLKGATLEASWRNWEAQSTAAIRRMQELETENNRLFN